jgi:MFS family permease
MKVISKNVWILSLVSLFTDIASEMLYPIMPIYLKSIGFSILIIGILEGFAEALAGLSKGYFGKVSDTYQKRLPFIQMGYGLSALSKPLLVLFNAPLWVFFSRSIDRLGKGIRTGARDAMLSDEAGPKTKGAVFGFHRSMDTLGAAIGPLIALAYLYYHPASYKPLFFIAFIPGALALLITFLIKEKKKTAISEQKRPGFLAIVNYWKESPKTYKQVAIGLLAFALINSSDVFLLLQLKQFGWSDTHIIALYILYNFVYAFFAFPMGKLADKLGLKPTFILGLILFSIVYLGFSFELNPTIYLCLFVIYGLYAAATEGIAKAWISTITDKKDTATAIGTLAGFQSICTLIASSVGGFVWYQFGASTLFAATGISALLCILYFVFFTSKKQLL